MIVGTTPTHIFNIPFDTSDIKVVRVLYSQDDNLILVKTTEDATMEGQTISVTLTQEDTFLFNSDKAVEVQIRILTTGGSALASIPKKVGVTSCLENEVIK